MMLVTKVIRFYLILPINALFQQIYLFYQHLKKDLTNFLIFYKRFIQYLQTEIINTLYGFSK